MATLVQDDISVNIINSDSVTNLEPTVQEELLSPLETGNPVLEGLVALPNLHILLLAGVQQDVSYIFVQRIHGELDPVPGAVAGVYDENSGETTLLLQLTVEELLDLLLHLVPGVDLLPDQRTLEEDPLSGQLPRALHHLRFMVPVHRLDLVYLLLQSLLLLPGVYKVSYNLIIFPKTMF